MALDEELKMVNQFFFESLKVFSCACEFVQPVSKYQYWVKFVGVPFVLPKTKPFLQFILDPASYFVLKAQLLLYINLLICIDLPHCKPI